MDIRKVKKLIEFLNESGIAEIEITEGEESVRISRYAAGAPAAPVAAAPPVAAAAPAPTAAPALRSPRKGQRRAYRIGRHDRGSF